MSTWRERAPAKLTWSLEVGERRSDGFHDLVAEMVSLDLVDDLEIEEPGEDISLHAEPWARAEDLELGDTNLIARALELCERRASIRLTKRIPLGGGLGGGSADAAAILRWAGFTDLARAAQLGGDVPFCVTGGRAMVRGLGEQIEPLAFVQRSVVLVIPPFAVNTAHAYRVLDDLRADGLTRHERNDLTVAAEKLAPALGRISDELRGLTGVLPVLAGSGSTLFLEGTKSSLGLAGMDELMVDDMRAKVIEASTIPAQVGGPSVP